MYSTKTIVTTLFTALILLLAGFSVAAFLIALSLAVIIGRSESFSLNPPRPAKRYSPATLLEQDIRVHRLSCGEDAIMRFMAGQCQCIELGDNPSPDFPQDVPVYGAWVDDDGRSHRAHIGFIPRQKLHKIYRIAALHPECHVEAHPSHAIPLTREKRFPGLNIDVAVREPVAVSN